jgi:hypothetical protein
MEFIVRLPWLFTDVTHGQLFMPFAAPGHYSS